MTETIASETFLLNVTLLEPRLKHPTIFKHFDELPQGEAFEILNDHDPKPLYYQMIAERGNVFTWQYLQKGPERWQVKIKKNDAGETIGEIAAKDLRKAEVFKKYGIDFCCGGKKNLQQACEELNVDVATIEAELMNTSNVSSKPGTDFIRWEPDFLSDYIYNQHHLYYYEEGPVIADLLEKVITRHGDHYPHLKKLGDIYNVLQNELKTHFIKEETVLFPFIKAIVKANKTNDFSEINAFPSIKEPVQMMEMDHEGAGELLVQIREVTNNYTLPADACNSFQLLYNKLQELEADLHQHIHLENNILFPKTLQLEKSLNN